MDRDKFKCWNHKHLVDDLTFEKTLEIITEIKWRMVDKLDCPISTLFSREVSDLDMLEQTIRKTLEKRSKEWR